MESGVHLVVELCAVEIAHGDGLLTEPDFNDCDALVGGRGVVDGCRLRKSVCARRVTT